MQFFDRVTAEAQRMHPLKVLLTILAVPFFVVGWLVGVVVRAAAFVLVWAWAAIKVGFREARGRGGGG